MSFAFGSRGSLCLRGALRPLSLRGRPRGMDTTLSLDEPVEHKTERRVRARGVSETLWRKNKMRRPLQKAMGMCSDAGGVHHTLQRVSKVGTLIGGRIKTGREWRCPCKLIRSLCGVLSIDIDTGVLPRTAEALIIQ
jgi:hypothetical protein